MKTNLLPALALTLLLAQCQKRAPDPTPPPTDPVATLPAETQTGAGTFGCLINGKPYYAPGSLYANGDWMSLTRLGIGGTATENGSSTGTSASINLGLNGNLVGGGSTPLAFALIPTGVPHTVFTTGTNQFFAFVSAPNKVYYSGQYIKAGQVTLSKFDGVARIASGRFAFTLYEAGKPDTLKITNGRFDVKF